MEIPEKLKINKFKDVRIPKKSEYFNTGRFIVDNGVYGGEKPVDVTGDRDKAETAAALLQDMEEFDRQRNKEE